MRPTSLLLFAVMMELACGGAPPVLGTTIESLGTLDFPNSGAEEAQSAFVRGVLLLHSFEYDDAREAFQEAQRIDPDFTLAYWGEAMTHNHPLWRRQDREAARAVLARMPDRGPTDRERGYVEAVEILFGEGDKVERDLAYSESMRRLAERFPDDLEAKSFHALSILGTTQAVRDFRAYMRAGAVAEEVFAANPRHPGAAHYLIHSYDDPIHAPLGLRAARVYDEIAPAASHAQHMISHIYVALGQWAESVDSNIRSFEVSRQRARRKGLGVDDLNFHAFHWLQYSYLQLGKWQKARTMLDQMHGWAVDSGSKRARGYYAGMRASWLTETGDTDIPPSLGSDNTGPSSAAADLFASGWRALSDGDKDAAGEAMGHLESLLADLAASDPGAVAREQHQQVRVMALALQAQIALADDLRSEARDRLAAATAIEEALPLDYGPPPIVKPSHEMFGEMLLADGEPMEASRHFAKALERAPRRRAALWGLGQAAAAAGDRSTASAACSELASVLAQADPAVGLPIACRDLPTRADPD